MMSLGYLAVVDKRFSLKIRGSLKSLSAAVFPKVYLIWSAVPTGHTQNTCQSEVVCPVFQFFIRKVRGWGILDTEVSFLQIQFLVNNFFKQIWGEEGKRDAYNANVSVSYVSPQADNFLTAKLIDNLK